MALFVSAVRASLPLRAEFGFCPLRTLLVIAILQHLRSIISGIKQCIAAVASIYCLYICHLRSSSEIDGKNWVLLTSRCPLASKKKLLPRSFALRILWFIANFV